MRSLLIFYLSTSPLCQPQSIAESLPASLPPSLLLPSAYLRCQAAGSATDKLATAPSGASQAESRHYYDRISNALPNSPQRCPLPASIPPLSPLSPFLSVSPFCLLPRPSWAAAVILALALIDASFCCVYLLFARRTHKSHAVRSFLDTGVLRACDLHLVLLVARFVCMRFPGIFTK